MAVGQRGRLQYEAVLLTASLRTASPAFPGRLIVAEPQPGPLWADDPRMSAEARAMLAGMGAEVRPFESRHFGQDYPHGNKIEGLAVLGAGRPFLFLDTDTLVLGDLGALPFDWRRPAASMRREATWPVERPGGPKREAVWRSLYDRFGLDFTSSLDPSWPVGDWRRYLYFNAGWFFGADAAAFGAMFLRVALAIRDDPPSELAGQPLVPWLDQAALPLVVHALGGGRPGLGLGGLDGGVTCHYRTFPLLYAREEDAAVAMLEGLVARPNLRSFLLRHEPLRRMVHEGEGEGAQVRAMFDRADLPRDEGVIRRRLRAEGLWLR